MANEEIGQRIKERRKSAGLSQVELASLIGASGQSVYYWESGKNRPGLDYVLRMSYVFGCEVGELLGGFKRESNPQ